MEDGSFPVTAKGLQEISGGFLLGIDTCGPTGSVALGTASGGGFRLLEQVELEGRSYSARLVAAVAELLEHAGTSLRAVGAIVAVNGPGSFTGVRVGLTAVKGLAEVSAIPVVAVSRLEVLAWKGQAGAAALDAHRQEIFLRLGGTGNEPRELLVGAGELAAMAGFEGKTAVCDDAAAELVGSVWPGAELVRVAEPTAADALEVCLPKIRAGEFADLVLLDGNYLRRSDAEIFGEAAKAKGA